MRLGSAPDRVPPMPQVSRKIGLEIDMAEGPLQGRVSDPDGLTSEFEGWLGLLTILVTCSMLLRSPAPPRRRRPRHLTSGRGAPWGRAVVGARPAMSAAWLLGWKRVAQLSPRADAELDVRASEVVFDGLRTDEQGLRDLAVAQPVCRQQRDAALAGCERVDAGERETAADRAGHAELLDGLRGERGGAAARGQLGGLGQRRARVGSLSGSPQGGAEPQA